MSEVSEMKELRDWFLAPIAVFGAFLFAGLAGSFVGEQSGLWQLPVAGFFAAFSVVVTAYFAWSRHKFRAACIALLVGAFVAWIFIEPHWYPETERYGDLAYQTTHLPFLVTLAGGFLGLLVAFVLRSKAGT